MAIPISYLAGFFDGEGNVGIKRRLGRQQDQFRIQIGQKRTDVLEKIQAQYGGHISTGGQGQVKRWVIEGQKAKALARKMLPYLIVKKVEVVYFLANTP